MTDETATLTERSRAKADRQTAIMREAARLFAERGFAGVSVEDVGAAVGVSGPAIYRHFAGKQALLGRILVDTSDMLRAGGQTVVASGGAPETQLDALIRFHVDFALAGIDVIRVQDRDMASLSDGDRAIVRRLQREYVELWVDVLRGIRPDRTRPDLRVRAHACFGLINSTPHSARALRETLGDDAIRDTLRDMAAAALRG